MAARKHHPVQITNLILPSTYQSYPAGLIASEFAITLAVLLNQGVLVNTTTNDYTAFVISVIGAESFDTANDSPDIQFNDTGSSVNMYTLFEEYILNIIRSITQGITLDTVLEALGPLQTQINTAADAANTIRVIQNVMILLLHNVQCGIDIVKIQTRLDYLQTLLAKETNLDETYVEINTFIKSVVELVTKKQPYGDLVTQLTNTLLLMQHENMVEVQYVDDITVIQQVLLSILQNITDGIDLGIVQNRLAYVQTLLNKVVEP